MLKFAPFSFLHFTAFVFAFFHGTLPQQPSLSSVPLRWQNMGQCYGAGNGSFFNAILMDCDQCPEGMAPSEQWQNECQCEFDRLIASSSTVGISPPLAEGAIGCAKCDKGLAMSRNLAFCVRCLAADGRRLKNTDDGTGQCPRCEKGEEIAQLSWHSLNGTAQIFERCVKCPAGTTPNERGDQCVPCQSVTCICEKNNSLPFCADSSADAAQIQSLRDGDANFVSAYIKRHLRDAEFACRRADRRQCSHLSNLCTLQNFVRTNGGACNALENARNSWQMMDQQRQPKGSIVPQLFYVNIDASMEIFRANAIDAIFELVNQRWNSHLDIVAMAYSMNGTLLGQLPFEGVFLRRCAFSTWAGGDSAEAAPLRFGTFFRQKCFWFDNGQTEDIFFELYLRFEDTNGEIKLYPVPILNEDIRGDQYTGWYPNRLDQLRRDSRVLLTKRFYLVDRQFVGAENGQAFANRSSNVQLIRSPKRIILHVHLQPFQEGRIFVPYLQIAHAESVQQQQQHQPQNDDGAVEKQSHQQQQQQPLSSSSNSTNSSSSRGPLPPFVGNDGDFLVSFEFEILYHTDSYPYDKTVEVVTATACSVAAVWAAIRAYSWGRRSGKLIIDMSTILKLVLYAADAIGNVFLLVMGTIAIWLTFAYKLQSNLFYVPLSNAQEGSFVAYLVSAVALKALSLAHTLVTLTLVQTFFIDWERPRALTNAQKKPIDEANADNKSDQNSAVIWRTYLIANEWNELQLYRKTWLSLQLLTVLFLLDYLHFDNFAKLQPGFGRVGQPSEIVETQMSRFAVDLSFYFGTAMAQWLVQVLIVERLTDPFRNFMDLCSVANISVLAMTNPLRGFYVHGRSVHGFADTDMLQMNVFLQRERVSTEDNLCAMRGLEMGSDLQTFIVNVPRTFRERLDHIMAKAGGAFDGPNANAADRTTLRVQQVATAYSELNECLKDFVNRVDPQCDYVITNARLIEALLGMEFGDTSRVGTFRRDTSECEYSSAFLYGNEWALLSFEMALFCLADLCWRSRVLAALLTFLLSAGIRHIVKLYFTHQLAKSSMVDSRFLI